MLSALRSSPLGTPGIVAVVLLATLSDHLIFPDITSTACNTPTQYWRFLSPPHAGDTSLATPARQVVARARLARIALGNDVHLLVKSMQAEFAPWLTVSYYMRRA